MYAVRSVDSNTRRSPHVSKNGGAMSAHRKNSCQRFARLWRRMKMSLSARTILTSGRMTSTCSQMFVGVTNGISRRSCALGTFSERTHDVDIFHGHVAADEGEIQGCEDDFRF